jgi:serine/threonine protein kinase
MADRGWREGQQLGNYRLTRLLGQGGFAEVYLGEHIYLKALAALKILDAELSEQDAASFVQEAQTLARLSHPHIVRAGFCSGAFMWPWESSIGPRHERLKLSRRSRLPDYSSRNSLPTC